VDDLLLLQVLQCLKHLDGEPPDQRQRHSHEVVVLNELVEIDREQLKRNDQVLPETQVVFYSDDVVLVVRVFLKQVLQNLQLHLSLVLELLFVPNNFQSDYFTCFMIKTLEGLSKGPFAQEPLDFVPVPNVIVHYYFIISLVIVIPEVVRIQRITLDFLSFLLSQEDHLLEVQDLSFLVISQLLYEVFQGFRRRTRQFLRNSWSY